MASCSQKKEPIPPHEEVSNDDVEDPKDEESLEVTNYNILKEEDSLKIKHVEILEMECDKEHGEL